MRKIKKLLALALAAVMAVSVMSMSASAEEIAKGTFDLACIKYWRPELRSLWGTVDGSTTGYKAYTDYVTEGGIYSFDMLQTTPNVIEYYKNGGTLYLSVGANLNYGGMRPDSIAEKGFMNDDVFKHIVIGGTTTVTDTSGVRFFGTHCFENSALETIVFENTWNPDAVLKAMYIDSGKYVITNIVPAELNDFCLGINGYIIEDYAFANCKNLTSVVFQTEPALYIGSGAFTGCPNLTITAPVGGAIEAHCIENGIKFVPYIDNSGNVVQANNRLFTNGAAPELGYVRTAGDPMGNPWTAWPNANYTPNPVMSGSYVINRDIQTSQDTQTDNNVPQEPAAPAGTFSDVKTSDWYYDAVEWAAANKIVNGNGDGGFNPTGNLQRCELAQVLYNMAGLPSVNGLSNPFDDVKASDWYYDAVIWCASKGIINGNGDGSFAPTGTCTRSALTQVIYNAFGTPSTAGISNPFSDVYAGDWYYNPVIWCASKGIVNGNDNGTFQPNGVCQRCALAQVMYNMNKAGITLPL